MVRYFTDLRVMVNGCLASLKASLKSGWKDTGKL